MHALKDSATHFSVSGLFMNDMWGVFVYNKEYICFKGEYFIMFCPYCGKQLNDEAKFCVCCGRPVSVPGGAPDQGNPQINPQAQPVPGNPQINPQAQPVPGNPQMNVQPQPYIPPASLLPDGEVDAPPENNTGLIVLIIILITLIILVGILSYAYIGGFIDF